MYNYGETKCETCGGMMTFICHTHDYESPLSWCPNCGTLAMTGGFAGTVEWKTPTQAKEKREK